MKFNLKIPKTIVEEIEVDAIPLYTNYHKTDFKVDDIVGVMSRGLSEDLINSLLPKYGNNITVKGKILSISEKDVYEEHNEPFLGEEYHSDSYIKSLFNDNNITPEFDKYYIRVEKHQILRIQLDFNAEIIFCDAHCNVIHII
jgi:hypothetical protein